MITILSIIYFSLNTLIAVEYFDKTVKYNWLYTALLYFFGVPYFIIMVLKTLLWLIIKDYFQIPFFYKFYFTKKFEKVDPNLIEDFERWKSQRGNSLKDRIYKHGCDLLIKRAKS